MLKAVRAGEGVEISVLDNGIGMDMALVSDDLFKMNKRFAPSVAEGKGLGLYIVHEQVKLIGGTISVSSVLGKGTEFKINIPIA